MLREYSEVCWQVDTCREYTTDRFGLLVTMRGFTKVSLPCASRSRIDRRSKTADECLKWRHARTLLVARYTHRVADRRERRSSHGPDIGTDELRSRLAVQEGRRSGCVAGSGRGGQASVTGRRSLSEGSSEAALSSRQRFRGESFLCPAVLRRPRLASPRPASRLGHRGAVQPRRRRRDRKAALR